MIALVVASAAVQPAVAPAIAPAPAEVWLFDQVRIPRDTKAEIVRAIEPLHRFDDIVLLLMHDRVSFERIFTDIDPATLDPTLRARILALPAGEPFVTAERDILSINLLAERKPAAPPPSLPPGA